MSYPVDITAVAGNITASFQPVSWLNWTSESNTFIQLFDNGCVTGAGWNCTAACQSPEDTWGSLETLNNCLAYTAISELLSAGNLSVEAVGVAAKFGILPSTEVDISHVIAPIDSCVSETLHSLTTAKLYLYDYDPLSSTAAGTSTPDPLFAQYDQASSLLDEICYLSSLSINTDIGGIGVFISYLMQVGIVFFAWLYSRALKTWIRAFAFLMSLPLGLESARAHSKHMQKRIDNTEQMDALISGLVEFQKAQSYFALTMQGAALLALDGKGSLIDATTTDQITMTVLLIANVATTGIVCIVFGLYMLHAAGKTSWYVSALSLFASVISVITWSRTRMSLGNLSPEAQADSSIPACGGHNPATFCGSTSPYWTPWNQYEIPIVVLCMTVLLSMLLAQSGHGLKSIVAKAASVRSPRMRKLKRQVPTLPSTVKRVALMWRYRLHNAVPHLKDGFIECAFAVMAGIMLWLMIVTYHQITSRSNQWTFGQLISVTIWVPSIIEWIYAATGGMEEAHSHRFTKQLKLAEQEPDTNSDEDIDQEMTLRPREHTFYRRLNSRSELELPLVHKLSSARSSFQEPGEHRHGSL